MKCVLLNRNDSSVAISAVAKSTPRQALITLLPKLSFLLASIN